MGRGVSLCSTTPRFAAPRFFGWGVFVPGAALKASGFARAGVVRAVEGMARPYPVGYCLCGASTIAGVGAVSLACSDHRPLTVALGRRPMSALGPGDGAAPITDSLPPLASLSQEGLENRAHRFPHTLL